MLVLWILVYSILPNFLIKQTELFLAVKTNNKHNNVAFEKDTVIRIKLDVRFSLTKLKSTNILKHVVEFV